MTKIADADRGDEYPPLYVRLANVLQNNGFRTWEEVASLRRSEFAKLKNVGALTLKQAEAILESYKLAFAPEFVAEQYVPPITLALIDRVARTKERVIIYDKEENRVAALVPIEEYQWLENHDAERHRSAC